MRSSRKIGRKTALQREAGLHARRAFNAPPILREVNMALTLQDKAKINGTIKRLELQNKELSDIWIRAIDRSYIEREINKNNDEIKRLKALLN